MSGLFANLFGTPSQQPAQQQQQQQQAATAQPTPAIQQQQQQQTIAGNAQNPDVKTSEPSQFPQNPLDVYAALYDNTNKGTQDTPPSFALDPTKLTEISSGISFTNGLDQEQVQKAVQGDMQAFMDVINQVGRNAYSMSLQHGGVLTDKFVGARSEYDRKAVNSEVSKQLVHQSLQSPERSHPVIQAEMRRMADSMLQAKPNASPAQIAQEVQNYFTQLAQAMGVNGNAPTPGQQQQQQAAEVDWDKWFDPKQ